jgi:hypothetical protein
VPWDPSDAVDPKLSQLRDDRGYSYADIITVHPEKLPDYDNKVSCLFLCYFCDKLQFDILHPIYCRSKPSSKNIFMMPKKFVTFLVARVTLMYATNPTSGYASTSKRETL